MAGMKKTGLGSGVNALFQLEDALTNEKASDNLNEIKEVRLSDVEPGESQPRKQFDDEKIEQLAESIKEHGIIQPLVVRKVGKVYKIIAGERRWRAARLAGLTTVPIIEKVVTDREASELAIIENIQREDLNPIEEAEAYDRLVKEYNLTQDALSKILSKSRPAIANTMRLLTLPDKIRAYLVDGTLSAGHGRALLGLNNQKKAEELGEIIIKDNLNVRQTEALVKKTNEEKDPKPLDIKEKEDKDLYQIAIKNMEKKLSEKLGTKVKLQDDKGKGKITIEFFSADEREKILGKLLC